MTDEEVPVPEGDDVLMSDDYILLDDKKHFHRKDERYPGQKSEE